MMVSRMMSLTVVLFHEKPPKRMQKELPLTSLQVRRLEFVILCKIP